MSNDACSQVPAPKCSLQNYWAYSDCSCLLGKQRSQSGGAVATDERIAPVIKFGDVKLAIQVGDVNPILST
jgi:hypothetical protein